MTQDIKTSWIDVVCHRPSFIKIKSSPLHGKGAYAARKIKKGSFLGNYMGRISPKTATGQYVFHSFREHQKIAIDASDLHYSNWTRWMNCSTSNQNENVDSYYLTNRESVSINSTTQTLEGYIVFYANRDINPGEELLYYYGDYYATLLEINYPRK
tara:strand:+ start:215 stop:682 length:468 start_codon:yes stop_codon:yes gene_type:complete